MNKKVRIFSGEVEPSPEVLVQHLVLYKEGLTFKIRLSASLYFGSGWTEFCWPLSYYLVLLFLYWASIPGWTNNNALPAQSPARCVIYNLTPSNYAGT